MKKHLWLVPALASLSLLLFTLEVMVKEGPLGFLAEHTRNFWGYQITIDLISANVIGLFLAASAGRRYKVHALPWVLLTVCSGSIGLFAFVARILYLQSASTAAADSAPPLHSHANTI